MYQKKITLNQERLCDMIGVELFFSAGKPFSLEKDANVHNTLDV